MCFDGFITLDRDTPSESGLYVTDLPGVTVAQLDGITKDEQSDTEELFENIYRNAQINLKIDIQRKLAQRFHIDKQLASRETSKFIDEVNDADDLSGVTISFDLPKYARTHVQTVSVDIAGFNIPQDWEVIESGDSFLGGSLNSGQDLEYIAYGDGKFVATSPQGMFVSEDFGETWAPTGPTDLSWNGVIYANGYWVAVALDETTDEVIAVSTDGLSWHIKATGITAGTGENNWVAIAYGNGRFVVVGGPSSGVHTRVIYSTDNGETWTAGTAIGTETWLDVAFGDGKFVAISNDNIMYSYDGAEWTQAATIPATTVMKAVTYGDGTWVIVGTNVIRTSADGNVWVSRTPADDSLLLDVIYADGYFMALSYDDSTLDTTPFKTSPDGITWTANGAEDIEGFLAIALAHGGGYVVAVSDVGVYNHTSGLYDSAKQVVRASAGNSVEINFYDENSSGDLLHTVTSEVTEGKNTIDVDHYFEVDELFVSVDPTKSQVNKTQNKEYPSANYRYDKLSCTYPCYGGTVGVRQINGGGLNVKFNIYCSMEKLICDNLSLFQFALWYRIGVDLMKERRVSDRVTRFTALSPERAVELMEVFNEDYQAALDSATMNIKMEEDPTCFSCKKTIQAITSLP